LLSIIEKEIDMEENVHNFLTLLKKPLPNHDAEGQIMTSEGQIKG
jgi:hypothetical protein